MNIDLFHTTEPEKIHYFKFEKKDPTDDEIEIKTKYCGICRSDIAAFARWETPMPIGHFGHEGIGTVTKVGKNIREVKVGDFVSTISDPAYGTYYNAKSHEFVKIPELSPKYILQPVACAVNILDRTLNYVEMLNSRNFEQFKEKNILMIGSGFMSIIIGQLLSNSNSKYFLEVVGNSNKKKWNVIGYKLKSYDEINTFPIIMDLSSKEETFYKLPKIADKEAIITLASTPFTPVRTNFFENSWNCHTFLFPSPRNKNFRNIMKFTVELISEGKLSTESLWTKGYSFEDAQTGFEDGVERTEDYLRGYIEYE